MTKRKADATPKWSQVIVPAWDRSTRLTRLRDCLTMLSLNDVLPHGEQMKIIKRIRKRLEAEQ